MSSDPKHPSSRQGQSPPHSAAGGETPQPNRETRTTGRVARTPSKISRKFGRYRIIRRLGKGGMGTVFLAEDTQLQREVALKIPQFDSENDHELLERFYREARAAATLNHPNLCPVHDVGEIDGVHYLTMAYIEGQSLSDLIRPGEPLEPMDVAAIVQKLALGMGEAHEKGIVHRDLKPANISINKRGEPVVMDFGLARLSDSRDARLTKSGAILGTPAYMAPEQIKGDINAMGPGCDIYSLGVILYELLTGDLPFDGPIAAVLGQVLTQEPQPPSSIRRGLDLRLEAICLKMMAKQREERFATMNDVADALGELLFEATHRGSFVSQSGPHAIPAANVSSTYKMAGIDVETQKKSGQPPPIPGLVVTSSGSFQQTVDKFLNWAGPRKGPLGIASAGSILIIITCAFAFQYLGGGDAGENQTQPPDEEIVAGGSRTTTNSGNESRSASSGRGNTDNGGGNYGSNVGVGGSRKEITNSIGMRLVLIPAGNFSMGESASEYAYDDERPRHRVTLTKAFYMGVYEVTQKEYVAIVGTNPAFYRSDRRPVESISWKDAQEFCRKLSVQENITYRLPTEAEWEYACRAGTTTPWHFGSDAAALNDYAWTSDTAGGSTSEAGRLKPNDFGLYDIHGNVSEWCEDWYSFKYYSQDSGRNPVGPQKDNAARLGFTKVVRGGSWDSTAAACRAAYRGTSSMMVRSTRTGFRVVRVVEN